MLFQNPEPKLQKLKGINPKMKLKPKNINVYQLKPKIQKN
jgi:hypothetical protein